MTRNVTKALQNFATARGLDRAEAGTLFVQRLNKYAELPKYGSNGAAGLDLHADLSASLHDGEGRAELQGKFTAIAPGERKLIKTGIASKITPGYYGRIAPRSGLAYKHGIDVMAGVIDEDYRGDIGVILVNLGDETFIVRHGDRIAQLVVTPYLPALVVEADSLDDTDRGVGGFGSTGT